MFRSDRLIEKINEDRAARGISPIRLNVLSNKISNTFGDRVEWIERTNHNGTKSRIAVLDSHQADALLGMYSLSEFSYGAHEHGALCAIEQILGVSLTRQYSVLGYRIDGYDAENNVAYEVDEPHHSSRKNKDAMRQAAIEKELGCKFVRISI